MDYEPLPCVKQFTLDSRLYETVSAQRTYDLKAKLAFCEELLDLIKRKVALQFNNERH